MEIKRIYNTYDGEGWLSYPYRYRLSLYNEGEDFITMEYEKFKVGFCDYEISSRVTSDGSTTSFLWGEGENPSWEEMLLKESEVKAEYINHFTRKIENSVRNIERLNEQIKNYDTLIQTVRGRSLRKHVLNGTKKED